LENVALTVAEFLFPDSEVKNEDPTIGRNCVRGMSVKTENFIFLHHVATCFGTPKVVSAGQLFFPASFCFIFWSTSIDFSRVPASFCVMPWNTSLDFSSGVQHLSSTMKRSCDHRWEAEFDQLCVPAHQEAHGV